MNICYKHNHKHPEFVCYKCAMIYTYEYVCNQQGKLLLENKILKKQKQFLMEKLGEIRNLDYTETELDQEMVLVENDLSEFRQKSLMDGGSMHLQKLIDALNEKKLSKSELNEVLLVAAGLTIKESADIRCVGEKTIKFQRTHAAQKLGINGTGALIRYVLGLLVPNLKNEVIDYLYPKKQGLDPLLWAGKLGEDQED